jgi:type IV secretion system protein VirD4
MSILLILDLLFVFVPLVAFIVFRSRVSAPDGRDTPYPAYAKAYLTRRWKWLATGLVGEFLFASNGVPLIGGLLGLGLAQLGVSLHKGKKVEAEWKARVARDDDAWRAQLGETHEQRVKTINEAFDRADRTLKMSVFHEFQDSTSQGQTSRSWLGFTISRNLTAMETREREFLRIVELLDSLDEGKEQHQWCRWARFGLLWGNGKATLDDWRFQMWTQDKGVQDGVGGVNWYMGQAGASTDAVISEILNRLEVPAVELAAKPALAAIVKTASARIRGGNAWLTADELADSVFSAQGPWSLQIGLLEESGQVLRYAGEGSMITIAPPGSGKTQCNVFPNLLEWRGPAVILDVKGEIYAGTSKWRSENVGPVFKFSPLDPANSHCYNPLSFIRQDTDYIWEDSRFLADMMIVPSNGSDPFWENKARDLLTAAIAWTCYANGPDERPMATILDIIHGGKPFDDMVVGLQSAVDVRSMMQQGSSLGGMNEKTRDSVLQTAQSSLSAWSGERISRATRRADWSPLDLRSGRNPTIYICLKPSEVESYISLLRVLIAQHIRMLTSELPPRDAAPILFLLDELPRLRQMPPVEEAIEIGRQYGLRLWMFAQSLGQLEKAYPNAEGMVGSCAVRIFMNPTAHDGLAEKLSEQIGYRESVMDGSRQRVVEASDLAGPAWRDYQVVLAASSKPVKVRKQFAWQDPELTARMGSL